MPNTENKQNLRNTFTATKYIFGFVWREKIGKALVFLKIIKAVIDALLPIIYTILIPGWIITELVGPQRMDRLLIYVTILLLTPFVQYILDSIMNWILFKMDMICILKIDAYFYEHIAGMDFETLEMPAIQIMKDRAQATLQGNSVGIINQISELLSAIISVFAIASIISALNPWIILFIVGIAIINALFSQRVNRRKYLEGKEFETYQRRVNAWEQMLKAMNHAKQLRIFNLKSFFIKKVITSRAEGTDKLLLRNSVRRSVENTFFAATTLIQGALFHGYVIYRVVRHGLGVGDMTIYMAAMNQFSGALSRVMNSYMNLSRLSLNIAELKAFMNIPLSHQKSGSQEPVLDKNSTIEFRNVSFKYPGSEIYALRDISITLHANERLCIVGENGSGKSTFIKLLTRLYAPSEGEILLNGRNVNEYDFVKYQSLFSPVFQDFVHYLFTLAENIVMAHEHDQSRLDEVCAKSGLSGLVAKLTKGYHTQVHKFLDKNGFEPSGGEAQRMAIARAIYHDAPIVLLDEPTAALDPVAEYEIYTQFNDMITDKTAVLITHRLSAVPLADQVAVFEKGRLVEYGTHKELYARGALYTDMFDKQAKFYRSA